MSIFHRASHVAISGGNLVAAAPGSTVTINQGNRAGGSSALKDLSIAAAHTALHDSAARFDAPRCHRNTRAKYLDKLEMWMLGISADDAGKRLIWLHGGAGTGKSAIMQSTVERCARHGAILGSFFFSRADPSRNYAEVLIPTLAYQLARRFPAAMGVLEPAICRDPLIFKASLYTQAYELLVRPLLYLAESGTLGRTSPLRSVFIIDGLDECMDPQKQALVIHVITSVLCDHHLPISFLIASRPEIAIVSAFEREKKLHGTLSTVSLDDDRDAMSDIRQFIEDSFLDLIDSHPWKMHIKLPWPNLASIDRLVEKSSGHFVYAATVMKFISSLHEHPTRALQVVEGLVPSRTGSPFAELDSLYMHILTSAKYTTRVLEILRHCYLSPLSNTVAAVCHVHNISPQDVSLFLSDVQSLVSLAPNSLLELCITPKHASLGDFLQNETRSQRLYIAKGAYRAYFLARYFQLLDDGPKTPSFCFRPSNSDGFLWNNDVSGLILGLMDGLVYSKDTDLLQSLVSRHAPHDVWNFCVESFAHDTRMAKMDTRVFLAQKVGNYMRAIRDSIALHSDALYFDQFRMYIDLLLDDLNDHVHLKPQYCIIPALMFSGSPAGLSAVHDLLLLWGHQFRIHVSYRYYFLDPLASTGAAKTDPRAFKAIRCLPQSQISWGSDLAVAMKLVLGRLVSLQWRGPSDALYSSQHRRWLQRHKPFKWISLGSPRLSSSVIAHDDDVRRPVLIPSKSNNRLKFLRSQMWSRENYVRRKRCAVLLRTVICYLRKSDHTCEVLRLAQRSLPVVAQWFPRLMKQARYEMDAYVHRWQGPSDRALKKAKWSPVNGTNESNTCIV